MDKPVITPLSELFSSRKFLLALSFIAAELLIRLIPDLRPYANDLSGIILIGLGIPFLHLSIEDLMKLHQAAPATAEVASVDLVSEAAGAVVELLATKQNVAPAEIPVPNIKVDIPPFRAPDGTAVG